VVESETVTPGVWVSTKFDIYVFIKGFLPATTTPMPQSNTSTSIGITHSYLNMTKGVSTGNVATTSVVKDTHV
jgi:hypothetical protein